MNFVHLINRPEGGKVVLSQSSNQEPGYIPAPDGVEVGAVTQDGGETFVPSEADRITGIKQWAHSVIIAELPAWKQSNMIKEAIRLSREERLGTISQSEVARFMVLMEWDSWVDAVRSHSDDLEADSSKTAADAVTPTPPTSPA